MKSARRAVAQALFLANLALSLALVGDRLRQSYAPAGSQDLAPLSAATSETLPTILVAEAGRYLEAREAVFVDARHPDSYKEGHIPTALSVPAEEEIPPDMVRRLGSAKMLIVYCDGPTCGAAEEVAQELRVNGLRNLKIMTEGWPAWTAAGMPTTTVPPGNSPEQPNIAKPSPQTAALLELSSEVLQLGQTLPGQTLNGQVEYKNVSEHPLQIARTQASCGCTVGTISKPSLQPGESGTLSIGFESKGRQGIINETVRLYIEGAAEPIVLKVEAEVLPAFTLEPAIIFPAVGEKTQVTMTSSASGKAFKIVDFKSRVPGLELKVLGYPSPGVADLEVTAKSPVPLPVGSSGAWSIAIKSDLPDTPPVDLFVAPPESK